jgi:hypothetical protein
MCIHGSRYVNNECRPSTENRKTGCLRNWTVIRFLRERPPPPGFAALYPGNKKFDRRLVVPPTCNIISALGGGELRRRFATHRPASLVREEKTLRNDATALRKDVAMGQDGHACMASAETSRNCFSVAPLAD